jgi:hypothetical protein
MYNRILSILVALSLLFVCAVKTSAMAQESATMPDLTQKGSLTFTMDVEGVPLDSGSLNLYYVATVTLMTHKQYDFRLLDALAAAGGRLNTQDLYDDEQAWDLLIVAQDALDQYLTQPIRDGKACFTALEAGLYLAWQSPDDASEGYDAIAPFLISVPRLQDEVYVMDVEADPKVPLETEPTTPPPPPPPPPPELPQTGQLNWPVPVMAVTGMALFVVGWILCWRGKRMENEK